MTKHIRQTGFVLVFFLVGCSTQPVVDVMDFFHPGKLYPNRVEPYGGVCGVQGAVLAPGACVPQNPLVPPVTDVPAVVPPPVPLPAPTGAAAPPPAFPALPPGR